MYDTEHIVQQYLIAIKGGSQRTIVEKCTVPNKIAKLYGRAWTEDNVKHEMQS